MRLVTVVKSDVIALMSLVTVVKSDVMGLMSLVMVVTSDVMGLMSLVMVVMSDVMALMSLVMVVMSDVMPLMSLVMVVTSDVMAWMSLMKPVTGFIDGFLGPETGLLLVSYMEAAVSDQVLAACAEFPNDNPGLHLGAIWYGGDVTGAPVCERPELPPTPTVLAVAEPPTDPTPPVIEADDEADDIEIVETLAFEDAVDESPQPPEVPVPEPAVVLESVTAPAMDDPFAMLVAVLEDVARASGADDAMLATLACLLGRTRLDATAPDTHATLRAQALAWQGILRGESEDFGACGTAMLDEWSAALIACVLGQDARADGLKRELRRRGVAAFGLVEQAA